MRIFHVLLLGLLLSSIAHGQTDPLYKMTTPLPKGRQMYGAAALNGWLYVIGGNHQGEEDYLGSVLKAPIRGDGTLGEWSETTALPEAVSYINNTTLVENGRVYIVGGLMENGTTRYRSIAWSTPGADGTLGAWQRSDDHPGDGVSCAVAVSTRNNIHLIGGSIGDSTPTDAVRSAMLDADGAVVDWRMGPRLPMPLWFLSAGVVGNRVYIWSGLTGRYPDSASKSILASEIAADGSLGEWSKLSEKTPEAFYSGACTVSGNILLTFCPRDLEGEPTGDIWYAQVLPQGFSAWVRRTENIPAKHYIGVATDRATGTVYLPGGRIQREEETIDANTYFFKLAQRRAPAVAAAPTTPPPPPAAAPPTSSAPARTGGGFLGYPEGIAEAQRTGLPMVIYFHRPGDENCRGQADALKVRPFEDFANSLLFVHVDVQAAPDIAAKYEVTTVPTWVFARKPDSISTRVDRVMQPEELKLAMGLLAQK